MFTLLGNCNHSESVYNLIPRSYKPYRRFGCGDKPSYVSRYHCKVLQEAKCQKTGLSLTMGVATVQLPCPENYLKKYNGSIPKQRSRLLTKLSSSKCPCPCPRCREERSRLKCEHRKAKCSKSEGFSQRFGLGQQRQCHASNSDTSPSGFYNDENFENIAADGGDGDCQIPDHEQQHRCSLCCRIDCSCNTNTKKFYSNSGYVRIERGQKDFIHDNAVAVLRNPPKVLQSRRKVLDCKGTTVLEPECMLDKKGYGQIPAYIYRRKYELWQAELDAKEAARKAERAQCRELSDQERSIITLGLQNHWNELYTEFQHLPLCIYTDGLKKRKLALESSLKDIEKDIQLFTRIGPLYVADVTKSHYL